MKKADPSQEGSAVHVGKVIAVLCSRLSAPLLATLRRVVIAVDPSGCAGEDDRSSDEIGIIAAGIGHDGLGRILEDATGRYPPDGWAHKSLELYDRWKADRIIAETNFGGAMVESTIRTARRTAPIKVLNASRGKVQRAEPVAALYAQGKVRHVGYFPELEGSTACSPAPGTRAGGRRITLTRRSGH